MYEECQGLGTADGLSTQEKAGQWGQAATPWTLQQEQGACLTVPVETKGGEQAFRQSPSAGRTDLGSGKVESLAPGKAESRTRDEMRVLRSLEDGPAKGHL